MSKIASLGLIIAMSLLSSCAIPKIEKQESDPTAAILITTLEIGPVSSNAEWTPSTEDINGVPMALVPPGCFMMGINEHQIVYLMSFQGSDMEFENFADQMPAHEVCFEESFWIDVHEVSQAQFSQFNGKAELNSQFSGDDLPREQITWLEASNFCELREARLPTEAEWEYAVRGPDGNLFPWGNEFDCRNGNFDDTEIDDQFTIDGFPDCDGVATTWPVGSFTSGESWVGVMDLIGNVWEWVADRYDSRYYRALEPGSINPLGPAVGENRVVRGGAWSINEVDHLSSTFRGGIDPDTAVEHLGFRCAKSIP